jgi:formylmethanofuran dehydrogenase subunit E
MRRIFPFLWMALILTAMPLSNRLNANEGDHDHPSANSNLTSHISFRPLTLEDIERFHGHLGPNVLLGVRMGEHACGVLRIPQHFGLSVVVECPEGPPHTCLIDGLQLSTGATMGKENISHKTSEEMRVTIIVEKAGMTVVYRLKDSTKEQLKKWQEEKMGLHLQSMHLFEMKPEDLFESAVTLANLPK